MKIQKYIKNSLLCLLAISLFSACDKALDEQPFSQVSDDRFWQTNADAEAGVTAIYDAMQKTYSSRYFIWGELRSDSYDPTTTSTASALEYLKNNLQPSNSGALRWNNFYSMIGRANLAIQKIPNIKGYNPNLLAEAHIMRAYAYFDGIRVWGGIPLFTEAIQGLDQELKRPRTDAAKILNEVIIPDMLKAEQLMSTATSQYRFSRNSIWAFQAQVYMYLKDYTKAKAVLDKIVSGKAYTLTTTREAWSKMFLNVGGSPKVMSGPELIFSLRYELTEDADRPGIYDIFFAGLPNYFMSARLENKWLAKFPIDSAGWAAKYPTFIPKTIDPATTKPLYGDWRYFESKEAGKGVGLSRVAKYNKTNYNAALLDNTDMHIFRYADVILMLAEAENQLGDGTIANAFTKRAFDYLNSIRTARQLPLVLATEFKNKADLENIILDERQMELLAEGKRWWDLVRTGKAVSVMSPINGLTEQRILYPIFQKHLIDNPLLTQTPGY
jgi:tetratricopeptide (TPR) repeat protein